MQRVATSPYGSEWYRQLLRARRKRQGDRGAAEKGDEFPPPHGINSGWLMGSI
jgi:hypothetical protein